MQLKKKLISGRAVLGTWITLAHPAIAEIMARAGFDFVTVDLEHSVITIREAEELIRCIERCGCAPLVRLSSNDSVQIKRVMDAGAHGLIVPMVNTADDALKAVSAMRYPPQGSRGVGLARAQGYGADFDEYRSWLDENAVFVPQIEHVDGVSNLSEILDVDGVDAIMVGPYDLSASLGVPGEFSHPSMLESMEAIELICAQKGAVMGLHVVEPDLRRTQEVLDKGYRFVAYSLDTRFLDVGARQAVQSLSKAIQGD